MREVQIWAGSNAVVLQNSIFVFKDVPLRNLRMCNYKMRGENKKERRTVQPDFHKKWSCSHM